MWKEIFWRLRGEHGSLSLLKIPPGSPHQIAPQRFDHRCDFLLRKRSLAPGQCRGEAAFVVIEKHAAARRLAHGWDMPAVPDRRAAEFLDALQKLAGVGLKKRGQLATRVAPQKFPVERGR